jgi:hypothetical protein
MNIRPSTSLMMYSCASLSQLQGENMDEDKTVYELMEDAGLGDKERHHGLSFPAIALKRTVWTVRSVSCRAESRTCFRSPCWRFPMLSS